MKRCYRCEDEKDLTEFGSDKQKPDKLSVYCKECVRNRAREKRYGLSDEQFRAMLEEQDSRCAVCGVTVCPKNGTLAVDHDHTCCPGRFSCGECVRGLVCSPCNVGMGYFADNPERLEAAAAYIRSKR